MIAKVSVGHDLCMFHPRRVLNTHFPKVYLNVILCLPSDRVSRGLIIHQNSVLVFSLLLRAKYPAYLNLLEITIPTINMTYKL